MDINLLIYFGNSVAMLKVKEDYVFPMVCELGTEQIEILLKLLDKQGEVFQITRRFTAGLPFSCTFLCVSVIVAA